MRDPFDPNFGKPQPWRLKVAVVGISLALMIVAAAACGGNDNFTRYGNARKTNVHGIYESDKVVLADGRQVTCLVLSKEFSAADDHHAIAFSCDWPGAK